MKGKRLINDFSFECTDLVGMHVEAFFGFYEEGCPHCIDMIMVKLREKDLWQRLFLDAGCGFWEECENEAAFGDYEDEPMIDFGSEFKLNGQWVKRIACQGVEGQGSSMIFEIGNQKLLLKYADQEDMESDTVFSQLTEPH